MPIYYPDILSEETLPRRFSYNDKDTILYALGIGMGRDPIDPQELRFVYEKDLTVVPTAATVLAKANVVAGEDRIANRSGLRQSSLNEAMILHGEQKVELHRSLPVSGTFLTHDRIIGAYDKGADAGAIVVRETTWTDNEGARIATLTSTLFARADGGFGGPRNGLPAPHQTPVRPPDLTLDFTTRPDQALLYRLNGDRNPLHCDPQFAKVAGFRRPVLHGLCTYGITCRAVLQGFVNFDAGAIASHQVRFSAPAYPGETISVDLWQDGREVSFEAHVKERNIAIIKHGLTILR